MASVPREAFLPPELAEFAYEDRPLPIEAGQTISQPYIVALMTEALKLRGDERVLEIGTGSGYAAAVIATVARKVYTIERHAELAEVARERLAELGHHNVELRDELSEPRLERAIGVVYRPETELQSHYFQAILPAQFDEYIWFDESSAVEPLPEPLAEQVAEPTRP